MSAMPLCVCGHKWGDHAMPPDLDYDIDNGERWCYAEECRCRRYVEAGEAGSSADSNADAERKT